MEQLEAVLKHKFWICFAVAVLVPTTGFYMVSGSMIEAINSRESQIKGKFSKIPKTSRIETAPNQQYIEGLSVMNVDREKRIKSAALGLRNEQKVLQNWPAQLRGKMKGIKYRAATVIGTRERYKNFHRAEYERIRKILVPFNPKDGTGNIQAPLSVIPQTDGAWVTSKFPPTNRQMWDTQEDIWLLASIFKAIARVNKNADQIAKAPVRALKKVSLHGGSKKTNSPSSSGPTGSNAKTITFKPVEVFGPDSISGAGRRSNEYEGEESRSFAASVRKSRRRRDKEESQNSSDEPTVRRYIDDEGFPFKTRGFYIEVIIEHQRLPNLLAELSNMPWPTKIVKVQQGDEVSVSLAATATVNPRQETRRNKPGFGRFGGGDPSGEDDFNPATSRRNPNVSQAGSRAFEAAMRDPSLSHVSIAGTMLIYKPPQKSKAAAPKKTAKSAKPNSAKGQTNSKKATRPGSKSTDPAKSTEKTNPKKQTDKSTPGKTQATPKPAGPAAENQKGNDASKPAPPSSKGKKTTTKKK